MWQELCGFRWHLMCHPLTPREATQAPVAKAALAKVSSTTADMYPCLPSFHFDTSSAASTHKARCSWDNIISFRTLWCSPHKRLSRRGRITAWSVPQFKSRSHYRLQWQIFLMSLPDPFSEYRDRIWREARSNSLQVFK